MTKERHIHEARTPSTWSQLYALEAGELCGIVESYLEDLISRDEFAALYKRQQTIHYDRVTRLVREISEGLATSWPLD